MDPPYGMSLLSRMDPRYGICPSCLGWTLFMEYVPLVVDGPSLWNMSLLSWMDPPYGICPSCPGWTLLMEYVPLVLYNSRTFALVVSADIITL